MATTDYRSANLFQAAHPHTFVAFQHFVMAMADFKKNRHKTGFFGRDKGLAAYKTFEAKLRNSLLALVLDDEVKRDASAPEYRETLLRLLRIWAEINPNWQDAYSFAYEYFVAEAQAAESQIERLLRITD